jgi:acetoin utilization deacetylase AcuC-like enzyme
MVHSLIKNYDLTSHLTIYQSKEATSQQMTAFHHPHYIKYLETWVSPTTQPIVEQYASLEEQQRIKSR